MAVAFDFVRCYHCQPYMGEEDEKCLALSTLEGLRDELEDLHRDVQEQEVRRSLRDICSRAITSELGCRSLRLSTLTRLATRSQVRGVLLGTKCTGSGSLRGMASSVGRFVFASPRAWWSRSGTGFASLDAIAGLEASCSRAGHTGMLGIAMLPVPLRLSLRCEAGDG